MASVFDVAAYILDKKGPMTAMKLQKLAYYVQAWQLVWEEEPLFYEEIQAWANGPVCVSLYHASQGQFDISSVSQGHPGSLGADQSDSVDAILDYYGCRSSQWLNGQPVPPTSSGSNHVLRL